MNANVNRNVNIVNSNSIAYQELMTRLSKDFTFHSINDNIITNNNKNLNMNTIENENMNENQLIFTKPLNFQPFYPIIQQTEHSLIEIDQSKNQKLNKLNEFNKIIKINDIKYEIELIILFKYLQLNELFIEINYDNELYNITDTIKTQVSTNQLMHELNE